MLRSIQSTHITFFVGGCLLLFIAHQPASVSGLEPGEVVVDDFDSGSTDFWQLNNQVNSTGWYVVKNGDPPPFGLDARRPPMELNNGYFLEIVPLSDSPAKIDSRTLELLPGATAELMYWNAVPFPIESRKTALLLYVEDLETQTSSAVFLAPKPLDPNPDWITVNIDLKITELSIVKLRIDGFRTKENQTGLAISKITITNGLNVTTTTTTTTTTLKPETQPVEVETEPPFDSTVTVLSTETPRTATKYDVTIPLTSTTLSTEGFSTAISSPQHSSTGAAETSTVPMLTPSATVSDTMRPTDPSSSSTSSSVSYTTTSSSSTSSRPSETSSAFPSYTSSSPATDTATSAFPSFTSPSSTTVTTPSSWSSSISSTLTTPENSILSTTSTTSSSTTSVPTTATSQSGLSFEAQLGIAIGVSAFILLLIVLGILFFIFYRRHRKHKYEIERRRAEVGTIRPLEPI